MMMKFCVKTSSHLSSVSSSPLLSSIVTLYALILLYVPHQFLRVLFSPVPIITGILLFSLLRLGATQKCDDKNKKSDQKALQVVERESEQSREESKEISVSSEPDQEITSWPEEDHNWVVDDYESETDSEPETGFGRFEDSFVGWNLRAPLEVIYEEEDEDEDRMNQSVKEEEKEMTKEVVGIERYASLSRYYPESEESDNSDDDGCGGGEFPAMGFWDSPESLGFRWEEEDREGLIEIALDGNNKKNSKRGLDYFQVEEDNLIEIDLSLPRKDDFPARNDSPPASRVLLT